MKLTRKNRDMKKMRLAILDLYEGKANQGMRCIKEIAATYNEILEVQVFDVRLKNEVPDLNFDLYITSGGPGNPLEGDGVWEKSWQNWVDLVWNHNRYSEPSERKHVFFICHSFQMACHHFNLGEITRRKSTSFGVYPVHKTQEGKDDLILNELADPYFVVDSRDWQLIQPRLEIFHERGAEILSLEKIRTHVELERAIMAVRFSAEMVGTQFHPEADAEGMHAHFLLEENKAAVIKNHGEEKYQNMMDQLEDPEKLYLTHATILPRFIENALALKGVELATAM